MEDAPVKNIISQGCGKVNYREFGTPKIFVVGIGGAGNNSLTRLHKIGISGAITIAVNTDNNQLRVVEADTKILIGKQITHGLGAGGHPAIGEQCALLARTDLEEKLRGADLVFVLAGMGGGTGTGASPIIAEIAKKEGALVTGIVSTPFEFERARNNRAKEGIEKLRKTADGIVLLDNNKLLKFVPNLPLTQGFFVMDKLVAEIVKGITETITQPSLVNLDYADVKTIVTGGCLAMVLYGESDGDAETVIQDTLNHPMLDVDFRGASGALVHITGGKNLTIRDAHKIASGITKELDAHANVIWGARIDESYNGKIKVMSIMTGVQSSNVFLSSPSLPH